MEKQIGKTAAVVLAIALMLANAGCASLGLRTATGTETAEFEGSAEETASFEEIAETERKTFEEIISAYENNKKGAEEPPVNGQPADGQSAVSAQQEEKTAEPASAEDSGSEQRDGTSEDNAEAGAAVLSALKQNGTSAVTAEYSTYAYGNLTGVELFTERDLTQNADLSEAAAVTLSDSTVIELDKPGVYVLTGTASDCTVKIDVDGEEKVQLVLAGVNVTNADFPAIYVLSADKVFVTTAAGTENTLAVTGAFAQDTENGVNTDAVIFSKEDLVLNGLGSLSVMSASGNGITTKDDLKITGGSWTIVSALDSLEANDSIAACAGTFDITSSKDGLHCENGDDDTLGWIWIGGGTWTVNAKSDAIQGTTFVQIDGGTLSINASEGIEGTFVQINGGTIGMYASDDGINASRKSRAYSTPMVEINGGELTVEVGPGDTDGIDSNGDITVNGGTIRVTAGMSSFDYDGTAAYNGGTIIVNGVEVDEIPQSMMGGGFGHGGGFGGGFGGFGGDFGGFGGFGGGGRGGRG